MMSHVSYKTRSYMGSPVGPLDFDPLGIEIIRELARTQCYQHTYYQYNDEEEEEYYNLIEHDNNNTIIMEDMEDFDMDYSEEEEDLFDGKKETTDQGEEGVWREIKILDEESVPTGETDFFFEIINGKSIHEIELQQAHKDAMKSLEGQAIEDIDFEAIEKLKQTISPVQAAEIDATIAKKHRERASFFGKDAGRMEINMSSGTSAAEAAQQREDRQRIEALVKEEEAKRKKLIADRGDIRPVKIAPCASVFRKGRWYNPCACKRGSKCSWAHSPFDLREANDNHICGFDGGKGLCTKKTCRHRHTVPTTSCSCGMRDLYVGSLRIFKGKGKPPSFVDRTAAILCTCPRRAETDAELKARCGQCLKPVVIAALCAPAFSSKSVRSKRPTHSTEKREKTSEDGWETVPQRRSRR